MQILCENDHAHEQNKTFATFVVLAKYLLLRLYFCLLQQMCETDLHTSPKKRKTTR